MKLLSVWMMSALLVCVASGEESRSEGTSPQPRPRLDAARQTAVATPVNETKEEAAPVLLLEKLVVKDRSALPTRPPTVEDPVGEFGPLKGGRYLRRDAGPFRFEAGVWPSINLFEEESRFKPAKVLIEFDFLRIKF